TDRRGEEVVELKKEKAPKKRKDKEKIKHEDEDPPVAEIGSYTSETGFQHGSWNQYPHQPMVPIRFPANGSIQEELGTDETAPLLKYSKSARTSQRDAHDMGINIIDDYRPIFSEEHHENDWHRDSLRPIS